MPIPHQFLDALLAARFPGVAFKVRKLVPGIDPDEHGDGIVQINWIEGPSEHEVAATVAPLITARMAVSCTRLSRCSTCGDLP